MFIEAGTTVLLTKRLWQQFNSHGDEYDVIDNNYQAHYKIRNAYVFLLQYIRIYLQSCSLSW